MRRLKCKHCAASLALPLFPKLLAVLVFAFPAALALGQLSTGDISVTADWPDAPLAAGEEFTVPLRFRAGEGIHVYKDKIAASFDVAVGVHFLRLEKPDAETIVDVLDPTQLVDVYGGEFAIPARFRVTGEPGSKARIEGSIQFQGCTDTVCFAPGAQQVSFAADIGDADDSRPSLSSDEPEETAEEEEATPLRGAKPMNLSRLLLNLLWAFGVGVLISLTPCVLPMIPVTAAVIAGIGKHKTKREAFLLTLVYVLGLAIVYAVAGVLASFLGQQVQNWLNSPWVRIPIAAIFTLLALAMFDVITIQTPQWLAQKLRGKSPAGTDDEQAKKGSEFGKVLAAFGMGMIGGVIAGPCVAAPLAGLLAHVALQANAAYGFWMMFAVAWGMGVLLVAGGTAPSLLPKAGGWMETVKKLFGFVLLWAALYFLGFIVGEAVYLVGTAALLIVAAVFVGCFDALSAESGFWPRAGRSIGIMAVLAALLILLSVFSDSLGLARPVEEKAELFRPADPAEVKEALESGQPVVLKFWTDYCVLCEALKQRLQADPRVRDALEGVAALGIDAEEYPGLAKEHGVMGVPALRFFEPGGRERHDLRSGDQSVDDFLAKVKQIKQESHATALAE